jgi:predicted ester cyclase
MAPDCVWVTPDGEFRGREAIAAFQRPFDRAFPDGEHTARRVLIEGDTVVIEGVWTGTHTGPLETPQGEVPPTGRRCESAFVVVADIRDEQPVRINVYWDRLTMMAQLGLMDQPAAA